MRKVLSLALGTLLLFSCKRDKSVTDETTGQQINIQNGSDVSKSIKVWHGTAIQGQAPAPSTNPNRPVLDPDSNNEKIQAIAGRYAIIDPQVESGTVAGYYLQVNGANEYFKVDYSKPRTARLKAPEKGKIIRNSLLRMATDSIDYSDSAIVISLPTNLKPGEFCITYCVYDAQGNISNPITNCIVVSSFGSDASSAYLHGTWNLNRIKEDEQWRSATAPSEYIEEMYCANNRLKYWCDSMNCSTVNVPTSIYTLSKFQMVFSNTGAFKFVDAGVDKSIDITRSTCSNYVYETENYTDEAVGAWSYNSSTKKLLVVFEYTDLGETYSEAIQFSLKKVTDKKIQLTEDEDDDEIYELDKQ